MYFFADGVGLRFLDGGVVAGEQMRLRALARDAHAGVLEMPVAALRFKLRSQRACRLPSFLGSTIRGALATALRQDSCKKRNISCGRCEIAESCAYAYLFETPPGEGGPAGFENAPHPIVLEPPPPRSQQWQEGETLEFGALLVGRGIEFGPKLVESAAALAKRGLGKQRNPFLLLSVESGGTAPVFSPAPLATIVPSLVAEREISIRFETPTRLKSEGKLSRSISFRLLACALWRRVDALFRRHCGRSLPLDWRDFERRAARIETTLYEMRLAHLARFSNRQKRPVPLDGMLGEAVYAGEDLPMFTSLLQAGCVLHVGKGTVFGLGKMSATCNGKGSIA